MELLYVLEGLRTPVGDAFFSLITHLGEETLFIVAGLLVFWCIDKWEGYYLLSVGLTGTVINQFLKLWFRIPRPWVKDPSFTIVESARAEATGYSFPSGHTQSSVGVFGSAARWHRQKAVRLVCILLCVLVPLSRMYLGVHTPADVLVGSGMALALVLGLKKPMLEGNDRNMKLLIAGMLAMAVGLLLYVELYPFPADVDAHNLLSGRKNAYTMLGCLVGAAVIYVGEKRYVNFETKAVWWAQVLKVVLGLALVLLVKEGLRAPLDTLFGGHLGARAVRYFLIVLTAGFFWPMTFRRFGKLGEKT